MSTKITRTTPTKTTPTSTSKPPNSPSKPITSSTSSKSPTSLTKKSVEALPSDDVSSSTPSLAKNSSVAVLREPGRTASNKTPTPRSPSAVKRVDSEKSPKIETNISSSPSAKSPPRSLSAPRKTVSDDSNKPATASTSKTSPAPSNQISEPPKSPTSLRKLATETSTKVQSANKPVIETKNVSATTTSQSKPPSSPATISRKSASAKKVSDDDNKSVTGSDAKGPTSKPLSRSPASSKQATDSKIKGTSDKKLTIEPKESLASSENTSEDTPKVITIEPIQTSNESSPRDKIQSAAVDSPKSVSPTSKSVTPRSPSSIRQTSSTSEKVKSTNYSPKYGSKESKPEISPKSAVTSSNSVKTKNDKQFFGDSFDEGSNNTSAKDVDAKDSSVAPPSATESPATSEASRKISAVSKPNSLSSKADTSNATSSKVTPSTPSRPAVSPVSRFQTPPKIDTGKSSTVNPPKSPTSLRSNLFLETSTKSSRTPSSSTLSTPSISRTGSSMKAGPSAPAVATSGSPRNSTKFSALEENRKLAQQHMLENKSKSTSVKAVSPKANIAKSDIVLSNNDDDISVAVSITPSVTPSIAAQSMAEISVTDSKSMVDSRSTTTPATPGRSVSRKMTSIEENREIARKYKEQATLKLEESKKAAIEARLQAEKQASDAKNKKEKSRPNSQEVGDSYTPMSSMSGKYVRRDDGTISPRDGARSPRDGMSVNPADDNSSVISEQSANDKTIVSGMGMSVGTAMVNRTPLNRQKSSIEKNLEIAKQFKEAASVKVAQGMAEKIALEKSLTTKRAVSTGRSLKADSQSMKVNSITFASVENDNYDMESISSKQLSPTSETPFSSKNISASASVSSKSQRSTSVSRSRMASMVSQSTSSSQATPLSRSMSTPRGGIGTTINRGLSSIEQNKLIAKQHKEQAEARIQEKMRIAAEQGRIAEEKARERLQQKLATNNTSSRSVSPRRPVVSTPVSSKYNKDWDDSKSLGTQSARSARASPRDKYAFKVSEGSSKRSSPSKSESMIATSVPPIETSDLSEIPTQENGKSYGDIDSPALLTTLSATIESNRVFRSGSMSSISSLSDSVFPNAMYDDLSVISEVKDPHHRPPAPIRSTSPRDHSGKALQAISEIASTPSPSSSSSRATPPKIKTEELKEALEEVAAVPTPVEVVNPSPVSKWRVSSPRSFVPPPVNSEPVNAEPKKPIVVGGAVARLKGAFESKAVTPTGGETDPSEAANDPSKSTSQYQSIAQQWKYRSKQIKEQEMAEKIRGDQEEKEGKAAVALYESMLLEQLLNDAIIEAAEYVKQHRQKSTTIDAFAEKVMSKLEKNYEVFVDDLIFHGVANITYLQLGLTKEQSFDMATIATNMKAVDESLGKDVSIFTTTERQDSIVSSVYHAIQTMDLVKGEELIQAMITTRRNERQWHSQSCDFVFKETIDNLLNEAITKHSQLVYDNMVEESLRKAAGVLVPHAKLQSQQQMESSLQAKAAERAALKAGKPKLKKATEEDKAKFLKAARNGETATVLKMLSTREVDVNAWIDSHHRFSALTFASMYGHYDIVKVLLESGGDPSEIEYNELTPFMMAAHYGYVEILKLFIQHGIDINYKAWSQGTTPLLYACKAGRLPSNKGKFHDHVGVVKLLLIHGADPNLPNYRDRNRTPLMEAIRYNEPELVKVLLDFGADAYKQDKNGQDAFNHASRSRRYEILQILNDDPRSAQALDIKDWPEDQYAEEV